MLDEQDEDLDECSVIVKNAAGKLGMKRKLVFPKRAVFYADAETDGDEPDPFFGRQMSTHLKRDGAPSPDSQSMEALIASLGVEILEVPAAPIVMANVSALIVTAPPPPVSRH